MRGPDMKQFWKMKALADGEAEILIYEFIGEDFWSGRGMDAKRFSDELKALGDINKIIVRINSPGGDVFDGNTIYNILKAHKAQVEVRIDGIAASIASVIAMAGDKIIMPENAMMMIHNPWGFAAADAVALGFADEMIESVKAAASFKLDYFKNVPQALKDPALPTDDEEMKRVAAHRRRTLELLAAEI